MHFTIPNALQSELLSYDPATRALAKQQQMTKRKDDTKKPKFPLGKVTGLIPEDIVKATDFNDAVEYINSQHRERRSKIFNIIKDGKTVPIAILYHFESVWYAAWIPLRGENKDYVYGYARAFRNNKTTLNKFCDWFIDGTHIVKYGKGEFCVESRLMTVDRLKNIRGHKQELYRAVNLMAVGKGAIIYANVIDPFVKQLRNMIPYWEDDMLFTRLVDGELHKLLSTTHYAPSTSESWRITHQDIVNMCLDEIGKLGNNSELVPIISTPFFRRWIQAKCDVINSKYDDPNCKLRREIGQSYTHIYRLLLGIRFVYKLWPDCPLDYYQTNIDLLELGYTKNLGEQVTDWIKTNMPVASYFNMMRKLREESLDRKSDMYLFSQFNDTFNMLYTLLEAGITVEPPKRWRLTEFHDYLVSESWKIKNKNISLPQDLFPEPVRIDVEDTKISFFQPIDTHQLSHWGKAVRNCVGSASRYADGITKKEHFIVLAMVDNKPTFTIQLELRHGVLNVKQIVATCNKQLSPDETDLYSKAFATALQLRASALTSS